MRYSKSLEELKDAPDEEVLAASLQAPEAFSILLARYEAAFLRRAQHILRSKEDAEEVVQDTFTRIYLYAAKYQSQEGAQFSSWAYTILTRQCFTRYQRLKRDRGRTLDLDPEAFERLPDSEIFLEELSIRNEVLNALSKLPETFARVLRLQFLEGKTQEEIAEIEESSVPAVKSRVFRAKNYSSKNLPIPMKDNSRTYTVIMMRVRAIHTLRALSGGIGASFLMLAASLYLIGREVWVARVFENMPKATDALAVGRFFLRAFESTDFAVQALLLLAVIAIVWMARELVKFASSPYLRMA